jgi:hypothetical protein
MSVQGFDLFNQWQRDCDEWIEGLKADIRQTLAPVISAGIDDFTNLSADMTTINSSATSGGRVREVTRFVPFEMFHSKLSHLIVSRQNELSVLSSKFAQGVMHSVSVKVDTLPFDRKEFLERTSSQQLENSRRANQLEIQDLERRLRFEHQREIEALRRQWAERSESSGLHAKCEEKALQVKLVWEKRVQEIEVQLSITAKKLEMASQDVRLKALVVADLQSEVKRLLDVQR